VPPVLWRSVAEAELVEATDWYVSRSREAARRFVAYVDLTVERSASDPLSCPAVSSTLRRASVPHFPYGLYFTILPEAIHIVGVVHGRRHPRRWRRRE
jgi:plasmid stabilization system protein ParE